MESVSETNPVVRLLLVSHSAAMARGLADLVAQVAGPDVPIVTVGGMPDGSLGVDGGEVLEAIRSVPDGWATVVLMDLGSSVLAVRAALAELEEEQRQRIAVVDAPLVEGAVAAGVAASTGASAQESAQAAREARHVAKL